MRIGNCEGLQNLIKETDVLDALKICNIDSKDWMLLLPSHIRSLICDRKNTGNLEEDDGKEMADNVTQQVERVHLSNLFESEDFLKREKMLQEELREEGKELLQNGYYIPQLKWNPNKLHEGAQ